MTLNCTKKFLESDRKLQLRVISFLQILGKADDPVNFCKTIFQVKFQALGIVQLTIAGKFPAAFFFCPVFTGSQQHPGHSHAPVFRLQVNPFQAAHRRAFHIVPAQSALS